MSKTRGRQRSLLMLAVVAGVDAWLLIATWVAMYGPP
jgi:hypothetical protein